MSTGSCFIRFHGASPQQPWAAAKSRHFVLAGERAQGFGLHASSGIGGLAVLLRQGAVHGSRFLASGDRKTSAVARLPGGADPDGLVRILGFLEGEHRLFAQLLRNGHGSVSSLQLRVKDRFRSRHDHRAGRARAPRIGP